MFYLPHPLDKEAEILTKEANERWTYSFDCHQGLFHFALLVPAQFCCCALAHVCFLFGFEEIPKRTRYWTLHEKFSENQELEIGEITRVFFFFFECLQEILDFVWDLVPLKVEVVDPGAVFSKACLYMSFHVCTYQKAGVLLAEFFRFKKLVYVANLVDDEHLAKHVALHVVEDGITPVVKQ